MKNNSKAKTCLVKIFTDLGHQRGFILSLTLSGFIVNSTTGFETTTKHFNSVVLGLGGGSTICQIFSSICLSLLIWSVIYYKRKLAAISKTNYYTSRKASHILKENYEEEISKKVRLQERRNISNILHDESLSMLAGLSLHLKQLIHQYEPGNISSDSLRMINSNLDSAYSGLRKIVYDLKESTSSDDHIDFFLELEEFIRTIVKPLDIDCSIDYELDIDFQQISAEMQIEIYRMMKECLTNTIKHARATKITVNIRNFDNELQVTISDNGVGIDPSHISNGGLFEIEKRIKSYMGKFKVIPVLPRGTQIFISLPFTQQ